MRYWTVIGIDHDDADTWNMYVKAKSAKEAATEAVRQYVKLHNMDPEDVVAQYVFQGAPKNHLTE